MSVTVKEFAEWLLKQPAEVQAKPVHCVQLNAGSKVEELRCYNIWDDQVCVDDEGA